MYAAIPRVELSVSRSDWPWVSQSQCRLQQSLGA